MYIPMESVWFLLGFVFFLIFAYGIYEFILKKRVKNDNKDNEKTSPEDSRG